MADHNKPALSDTYANFLAYLSDRIKDVLLGGDPASTTVTNPPTNAIRWELTTNKRLEKYNGSAWVSAEPSGGYNQNISGNAATATKWAAGKTIQITGDVAGTSGAFDGSANLSFVVTLPALAGLSAGSYGSGASIPVVTINTKGQITAITTTTNTPAWSGITGKPTTLSGYGITDGVNKTGDTMTGTLTFKAGTTTVQPAKFQAGSLLTTPVAHSYEWDGSYAYYTTSGGTRKQVAYADGTGASGTWGIGISGNAATATNATNVTGTVGSATTGTTQTAGDNSTKIATTAYADASSAASGDPGVMDLHPTLTSGVPITTADVVGASTIYLTPYIGKKIGLYTGSAWVIRSTAEISLALSGLTTGTVYDLFCYDNAGTPTLEVLAWSTGTARATALAYQDGILVKSGAPTRRYMATFVATSATTTEDSKANRYLWSYYNRTKKLMERYESTASWTYQTPSYRQANNNTANQLNFVIGVAEDAVYAKISDRCSNTSTGLFSQGGIGLDSTTTVLPGSATTASHVMASTYVSHSNGIDVSVGIGKHYFAWLEYSQSVGTTTWDGAGVFGITGSLFA